MNGSGKLGQEFAGIIGVLFVLGSVVLAILQVARGEAVSIPPMFIFILTLIVGYYFGKRTNGSGQ